MSGNVEKFLKGLNYDWKTRRNDDENYDWKTRRKVEDVLHRLDMEYGIEYDIKKMKDWKLVILIKRRPPYYGIDARLFEKIIREFEKIGYTFVMIDAEMGYIKIEFVKREEI